MVSTKSSNLVLLIVFAISIFLRVLPTFLTGEPFSTDSWPLIRDAEILREYTPVDLRSPLFDGYNNYWPGSFLFSVVGSEVLAVRTIDFMRYLIPITSSFSIIFIYIIARRLWRSSTAASLAALILGTSVTHVIFTSGVVKEGFAGPLYLQLILLTMVPQSLLPQVISSISLVITHHLTTLNALGILAFMAALHLYWNMKSGSEMDLKHLPSLLALSVIAVSYYLLYAKEGFKYPPKLEDVIDLIIYYVLGLFISTWLLGAKSSGSSKRFKVIILPALILALAVASTVRSPVSGLPHLDHIHLVYWLPLVLIAMMFYPSMISIKGRERVLVTGWLLSTFSLELFSVFSGCFACSSVAYREINFLLIPIALISSAILLKRNSIMKVIAVLLAVLSITSGYLAISWSLNGEDRLTYFWTYTRSEARAMEVLSSLHVKNLMGDEHDKYLASYYSIEVKVGDAFELFLGIKRPHGLILIHRLMGVDGFSLGPSFIPGKKIREVSLLTDRYLVIGSNEVCGS